MDQNFRIKVWSISMEMATHSSILAWEIPWTEELGRLQSMELQRVRHDQATNTYNIHNSRIPGSSQSGDNWVF